MLLKHNYIWFKRSRLYDRYKSENMVGFLFPEIYTYRRKYMNFNTPNNTMSFQKFFGSAKRELILCQPFPYMIEICRCGIASIRMKASTHWNGAAVWKKKWKRTLVPSRNYSGSALRMWKTMCFITDYKSLLKESLNWKFVFLTPDIEPDSMRGVHWQGVKTLCLSHSFFYCQLPMCYDRKRKMCSIPIKLNTVKWT